MQASRELADAANERISSFQARCGQPAGYVSEWWADGATMNNTLKGGVLRTHDGSWYKAVGRTVAKGAGVNTALHLTPWLDVFARRIQEVRLVR